MISYFVEKTEAEEIAEFERYYKSRYKNACKNAYQVGYKMFSNGGQAYTLDMLRALKDMAMRDIWPDFSFSAEECIVWDLFHTIVTDVMSLS